MTTTNSTKSAPPVAKFQLGGVSASVWENETKHGVMHTVTIERSYHDGQEFKPTKSFDRDSIPLARKVLDLAHTKIFELAAASRQRS